VPPQQELQPDSP
jgi:hypothetical protein